MLAVLFFSLTGITLNHPEWTFGTGEVKRKFEGKTEPAWISGKDPDWLTIAETMRKRHGLKGTVEDRQADEREASLTFKGPGYSADVFIDRERGSYEVEEVAQGNVSVLNDLHRGRDSGHNWSLLIDLSGVFLSLVALTGVGLLFYLKKIRTKGLAVTLVGGLLCALVAYLALAR